MLRLSIGLIGGITQVAGTHERLQPVVFLWRRSGWRTDWKTESIANLNAEVVVKMRWSDLWRWEGEVSRGIYVTWGSLLFAVKYNLDRALAYGLGRSWSPLNYVLPGRVFELTSRNDVRFCLTMLAVALPFVWAGVALTLRRLRSVGWPLGLAMLFFVPFVNFAFFAVLAVVPSHSREGLTESGHPLRRFLDWVVPNGRVGSAALGVFVTVTLGLGAIALSVQSFQSYGLGLFVLVPF